MEQEKGCELDLIIQLCENNYEGTLNPDKQQPSP